MSIIEFFKRLFGNGPKVQIEYLALFGDSHTWRNGEGREGHDGKEFGKSGIIYGFMNHLTKISGKYVLKSQADNFGIGGDASRQILSRVNTVKKTKAKLVIVSAVSNAVAAGTPPSEIVTDLSKIHQALTAMGKTPVLLTSPPRLNWGDKDPVRCQKSLENVNGWLVAMRKRGWIVADLYPAIIPAKHLNPDQIHLNKAGGEVAAVVILNALEGK
jgi:lysophospholipase L1-like esterase